jgi:hypothetical protein
MRHELRVRAADEAREFDEQLGRVGETSDALAGRRVVVGRAGVRVLALAATGEESECRGEARCGEKSDEVVHR